MKQTNKRGISVMIGYVLLITFAVIMSAFVYQWMKSYVPKDKLECPDGTSLFLKESSYSQDTGSLSVTLRNNGRFNVAGYFIKATETADQELATTDLTSDLNSNKGYSLSSGVLFLKNPGEDPVNENVFEVNNEVTHLYNVSGIPIFSIEIIPFRYQEQENKNRLVTCGDARVTEEFKDIQEGAYCGDGYCKTPNDCLSLCDECTVSDCCGDGNCEKELGETAEECTRDCGEEITVECGDGRIEGNEECDDEESPPTNDDGCSSGCLVEDGWACDENTPSNCHEIVCGDGLIDGDEECDDRGTVSDDGCSSSCTVESGYTCSSEPSDCQSDDLCGNGDVDSEAGEECDDWGTDPCDGCDKDCHYEIGACTKDYECQCTDMGPNTQYSLCVETYGKDSQECCDNYSDGGTWNSGNICNPLDGYCVPGNCDQ